MQIFALENLRTFVTKSIISMHTCMCQLFQGTENIAGKVTDKLLPGERDEWMDG